MNKQLENHFFWKYVLSKTSILDTPKAILFDDAIRLVKFSYVAFAILAFIQLGKLDDIAGSRLIDALWPVSFVNQQNLLFNSYFLSINLILSLILVLLKNTQWSRVYLFVIYFLLTALTNSFGKINHASHLVLIPLFCFALMPSKESSNYKEKTILMFLSAKFFLLVAYTLTGFWKVFWGVIELFTQNVSLFSPLSFRNVLIYQFEITPKTVFGDWFIEHYVIGWVLYLLVIYLELFSIVVFFKPNLYKIWGVGLIMLHVGLGIILGVNNYMAPFAIGVLLILSPFQKETSFKEMWLSLPIIDCFKYLKIKKQ
ncbi:MAG: hypothetical protein ACJA1H_002142 [Glaciecola sp.]